MESIATWLLITYAVGWLVSGVVYRLRAGLPAFQRIGVFGTGGVRLGWFAMSVGKIIAWPFVLGVWLATGRPEPRIVYDEKAAARKRGSHLGPGGTHRFGSR